MKHHGHHDHGDRLRKKAHSRNIGLEGKAGGYTRHVLMCASSDCVHQSDGDHAWKFLNKRLKALEKEGHYIYRSRVECLFVCKHGPILVVYPEGVWYGEATPDRLERIIREHLLEGRIIEEWAFARNPLPQHHGLSAPAADGTPSNTSGAEGCG